MDRRRAKLEGVRRWRQAAAWSPVAWLPLVVYWLSTERAPLAVAFALAGVAFMLIARCVVWSTRCPQCETRFGATPAGFRRIWNDMVCDACGLSLFELRRARARD